MPKKEPILSAVELLDRYAAGIRDFSGASVDVGTYRDAHLSGADLRGANLTKVNLSDANLSGANLADAKLGGAVFNDANLSDTELNGADLADAQLRRANLRRANLTDARCENADFSNATLLGARLRRARMTSLSGAELSDADLQEANLGGADLSGAKLRRANLANANLIDADFFDANLQSGNFNGAYLSGANLRGASVRDADFGGADLGGAQLSGADLRNATFVGANLAAADLSQADLTGAEFAKANLRDVIIAGAVLINLDLTPFCTSTGVVADQGTVDFRSILRSVNAPDLRAFLRRTGMPDVFVQYMVDSARSLDPKQVFTLLQSTFISYGGPDEAFARKLNDALKRRGVVTFFFKDDAPPGENLHRVMRKGVNEHDRVILVCSKASLERPGLLNELEETLKREARDGGRAYLLPIRLDDYVIDEWEPSEPDVAQTVRDRVIADFRLHEDPARFEAEVSRLIAVLRRAGPVAHT
jgi:uncharacterized protein YjbI with pentapeptide repeats